MNLDLFQEADEHHARSNALHESDWPFAQAALERLKPEWQALVRSYAQSPSGEGLQSSLRLALSKGERIFPPRPLRLLESLAPQDVKVVVLGQDPYHGLGQAEGLAFSVAPGVKAPPSLVNIFKELERDLHQKRPPPAHASLMPWVHRGVFLLNPILTVKEASPLSHQTWGWQDLTHAVLKVVWQAPGPKVIMLWGAQAQKLFDGLGLMQHEPFQGETDSVHVAQSRLVLRSNHPSPLSALKGPAPFIGCGHFSKAQTWLSAKGIELDWRI